MEMNFGHLICFETKMDTSVRGCGLVWLTGSASAGGHMTICHLGKLEGHERSGTSLNRSCYILTDKRTVRSTLATDWVYTILVNDK